MCVFKGSIPSRSGLGVSSCASSISRVCVCLRALACMCILFGKEAQQYSFLLFFEREAQECAAILFRKRRATIGFSSLLEKKHNNTLLSSFGKAAHQ